MDDLAAFIVPLAVIVGIIAGIGALLSWITELMMQVLAFVCQPLILIPLIMLIVIVVVVCAALNTVGVPQEAPAPPAPPQKLSYELTNLQIRTITPITPKLPAAPTPKPTKKERVIGGIRERGEIAIAAREEADRMIAEHPEFFEGDSRTAQQIKREFESSVLRAILGRDEE